MKEFIELVTKMREAQKNFFQTKDRGWLTTSKRYERQVDKELDKFNSNQLEIKL